MNNVKTPYQALLFVSFGGPEGPDEVMPFLQNVLRGRNVPEERMLEVAEHYQHFGGISPINEQNRQLIRAVEQLLVAEGPQIPVYFGNRNWHPLLTDTIQRMADDGIERALAFVTSAFSSYSGCRQYREDIQRAQQAVGKSAPQIDKLRVFYNHPGFIDPLVEHVRAALDELPSDARDQAHVAFTAHSIPQVMADGCSYVQQLHESVRLVAERTELQDYELVYQSRSGPPTQPWLEPDICDHIRARHQTGRLPAIVVVPIGFISDHMEVLFDLDTDARELCEELQVPFARAATVGTHPKFVRAIRELVVERMTDAPAKQAYGCLGPSHDVCPDDCCLYERPTRQARPS